MPGPDSYGELKLWDLATNKERSTFKGPSPGFKSLAFASDGKTLAVGMGTGKVGLWDVRTFTERKALDHGVSVYCVAFSPDGRSLASAGLGPEVKIWDVSTGKQTSGFKDSKWVIALAFAPDGKTLAAGNAAEDTGRPAEVKLWNLAR